MKRKLRKDEIEFIETSLKWKKIYNFPDAEKTFDIILMTKHCNGEHYTAGELLEVCKKYFTYCVDVGDKEGEVFWSGMINFLEYPSKDCKIRIH